VPYKRHVKFSPGTGSQTSSNGRENRGTGNREEEQEEVVKGDWRHLSERRRTAERRGAARSFRLRDGCADARRQRRRSADAPRCCSNRMSPPVNDRSSLNVLYGPRETSAGGKGRTR